MALKENGDYGDFTTEKGDCGFRRILRHYDERMTPDSPHPLSKKISISVIVSRG